jgi:Xaa-Pro aminopeptidase
VSDDVVIFGDTERSPALRHEVPLGIGDAFTYVETGGGRFVVTNMLERDRIAVALPSAGLLLWEELGSDELIAQGRHVEDIAIELCARACARLGVRSAAVPPELPVAVADRLRADGIELRVDRALFERRRRAKSDAELAGIRRAQAAADAGMAAAAATLRAADVADDGALRAGGAPLTAEAVRAAIRDACAARGAPAPADVIVAPGAQGASGHEPGSGPLHAGVPIVVDLWPQDEASSCFADMTRTFVVGDVPDEVATMHRLTREALERAREAVRAGVRGVDVFAAACEVYEAAGVPTQRTKAPGRPLAEGFFHGLGHGVGLEIHEAPALGRTGGEPLVAGDVVTIEPGTYRQGYGGVRLEDLLLVTDDGAETLTDFPYDLTP